MMVRGSGIGMEGDFLLSDVKGVVEVGYSEAVFALLLVGIR